VENEELVKQLKQLLDYLETAQQGSLQQSEKFQIALSNTLRLTEASSSTLSRLQGKPEDLTAYLIRLSTDLCANFQEHLNQISARVDEIVESLQPP
jgi:hypothetical protein